MNGALLAYATDIINSSNLMLSRDNVSTNVKVSGSKLPISYRVACILFYSELKNTKQRIYSHINEHSSFSQYLQFKIDSALFFAKLTLSTQRFYSHVNEQGDDVSAKVKNSGRDFSISYRVACILFYSELKNTKQRFYYYVYEHSSISQYLYFKIDSSLFYAKLTLSTQRFYYP